MTQISERTANPDDRRAEVVRRSGALVPGLILCFLVALAAHQVSAAIGGPAMLYVVVTGMALGGLFDRPLFAPGIAWCARSVLRLGVALLGARVVLGDVAAVGADGVALVVAALVLVLVVGARIGRWAGLGRETSMIAAASVAICGASAALAVAAAMPRGADAERKAALVVIAVTALGTVAMILYPLLAVVLHLDERTAGLFIGGSVHEVAQVVAGGYMVSDEAGRIATIVKLIRVACLVPVVLVVAQIFGTVAAGGTRAPLLPPAFLVGFVALAVAVNTGLVPVAAIAPMGAASQWFMLAAVAALGLQTSLRSLIALGPRTGLVMAAQTLLLALFVLAALLALG